MQRVKYRKARCLIHFPSRGLNGKGVFVEVPGYLFHYEPYDTDLFVHRRVRKTEAGGFYMVASQWRVSDPSSGWGVLGLANPTTREGARIAAEKRLSTVPVASFNEKVWDALQHMPPHKPTWRIVSARPEGIAVRVENDEMV